VELVAVAEALLAAPFLVDQLVAVAAVVRALIHTWSSHLLHPAER
jgi:hypothetical protein